ncbi:COG3400 family protein [Sulfurospirillum arcachonense]|uniref:COG3400 family protein n=1 Tax=Sulfurospirillum arcachonense TaxID=57666 RepID=UPI000469FC68|nr:TrkA C-terminal domain-containing protein [Sulfurospirillum arcachonense]
MKKILIIADGILAKHFLERVMTNTSSDNLYDVVTYRDKTVPSKKSENFIFYNFDPTSFEKLSVLLNRNYYQIMVVVSKKIDAIGTYQNIRTLNKDVQIILLDRWELEIEDNRLENIGSRDVLSSRFVDFLPDMPVIAQNVGLGAGEIMEIRVPIGSSYVYRHLASIAQKKWKISAIYRANRLILPRPTLMIQPNDVLLAIGDPTVLESVYRSIKQDLGQFPSPFGNSIYCLVDMLKMNNREIDKLVNDALLLHAKISSMKLYIKVINPTYSNSFEKIKSYNNKHIRIEVDYYNKKASPVLKEDLEKKDIGLIVVSSQFFIDNIVHLYNARLPIFKVGSWGFASLKEGVVLSSNSEDIEKESAVIFDVSSQLDLDIKLYNFNPDNLNEKNALAEHFDNLAKLFGKSVEVITAKRNPLLKLRNRDDILQFVPFNKKIIESNMFSIFSTDMERLYFKLSNSYQLFIPMSV